MKLELTNKNYCATVVQIEKLLPLENCDNVQLAIIMNQQVIVSKDVKIGDIGLFFPVECQLSEVFLSMNNLFSDKTLNIDNTKKGYFPSSGRIKCQKFRGHYSEGYFHSLTEYTNNILKDYPFKVGDEFNSVNGFELCKKYIIKLNQSTYLCKKGKKGHKAEMILKIRENQFRLHYDTLKLKTNIHKLSGNDYISITSKIHGSSYCVAKVLCKRKITWKDKLAKFFGVTIKEDEYKLVCSSRNVIKDPNKIGGGFYKFDIWSEIGKQIEPHLMNGMTMYGEVYGYLPNGAMIQKGYSYGCLGSEYKYFVYRITMTNDEGKVIEMPYQQMCEYLDKVGIDKPIEEYYGTLYNYVKTNNIFQELIDYSDEEIREIFLKILEAKYQNKMCQYNDFKVPTEGVVIRKDRLNESEAYKYKNILFLDWETKQLDSGETNIEDEE